MNGARPQGSAATRVAREGAALVFTGPIERAAVHTLWAAALPLLDGADAIDLAAVPRVDSAGLALLAELQDRAAGRLAVRGSPDGLPGLQAAYRLDASLQPA
jgi:phospholipid transport system transporter-binding protein